MRALRSSERLVFRVGAGASSTLLILGLTLGMHAHLVRLRARVAQHEADLAQVRQLAAVLAGSSTPRPVPPDTMPLVTRLETTAASTVGRERVVSLTPEPSVVEDGVSEAHVTVRLSNTALPDLVRFIYGLETAPVPTPITQLALSKRPDNPQRFDATLTLVELTRTP